MSEPNDHHVVKQRAVRYEVFAMMSAVPDITAHAHGLETQLWTRKLQGRVPFQ
jgi:hypothetical protein